MTVEINRHPLAALTGAMETVLELSGAGKVVEACNRLATALEALRAPTPAELPEGVRRDIHRLTAVLAFPTWEEVVRWAAVQGVDLRDLTEPELAYIERVSPKTARDWRTQGTGPAYRNEAGIRYPARELWTWRQKGRQTMTSQRARRGRRPR
jgi:hypothetical protein